MNFIDLSLRRPVFAWILMSALIIFGAISLNRLGVSQMPDVDFPVLNISVSYEGASPEIVEAEVIDPVEARLLSVEGLKEMRSSVRQGSGSVTLEFDIKRNIDVALQEVQSALSQLRLPEEVDPPVIRKSNPEEDPIMFISIFADRPLKEVINWTEIFLLDQLRFLPKVGEVSIAGFSQRNLRIWPDLKKLEASYLTVNDIGEAIRTQHLEAAAGQLTYQQKEFRLRWLGEAYSVPEVESIHILRRGGQAIQLQTEVLIKDVARVEDGLADIRRVARVENKEAITIAIRKQRGSNEVEVAKHVREKLAELKAQFPEGIDYRINIDFTRPTEATVDLTIEKLWVASLVTIFICFLFLGSWHAAVNILFSIPTSIVGTFIVFYFSGFTLNLFTLLALTLAVSIVVDDAIMLLENIVRHYRMGKTPVVAASDGAKEILPAAIAATLAVVAVFLPVIFMDGVIGKFFFQFGVALSAAVLLSLVEAITITPMRAATFMKTSSGVSAFEKRLDHIFEKLADKYRQILAKTLAWPKLTVFLSLGVFALSLFLIQKVRKEFVPQQDQDIIILSGQAPLGTPLDDTVKYAEQVSQILSKIPEVKGYFFSAGAGGPSAAVNSFFMPVHLHPRENRARGHLEVMGEIRNQLKGLKEVRVNLRDISARSLSAGRSYPISFNIRGADLNILKEKAEDIKEYLSKEGLAQDLDTDFKTGLPELIIEPNREAMARRGVSIEAVSQLLLSVAGLRVGSYTADGHRYDIRLKVPEVAVQSPNDLSKLYVRNLHGNLIPLSELISFKEQKALQSITRVNRQRAVAVFGNLMVGQSQAEVLDKAKAYAIKILPEGYAFALEGAAAGFNEAFDSLYFALLIGILIAYMILAIQFNSFIHPISVLVALPFSITGALLALWLFDVSLNLFSFIGIIVLMGIAKKNSILLVEFTNQKRDLGTEDIIQALKIACPVRLRPILMTSVATVAAALPLVIGSSIGAETRLPMGLTILGGTFFSTLLTLFVVPALYFLLSRFESKSARQEVLSTRKALEQATV